MVQMNENAPWGWKAYHKVHTGPSTLFTNLAEILIVLTGKPRHVLLSWAISLHVSSGHFPGVLEVQLLITNLLYSYHRQIALVAMYLKLPLLGPWTLNPICSRNAVSWLTYMWQIRWPGFGPWEGGQTATCKMIDECRQQKPKPEHL